MSNRWSSMAMGVVGAVAGAAVGVWAAGWAAREGFYAMALPGGLMGLGFALAGRVRSRVAAILLAVAAVPVGLYAHWSNFKFIADPSLGFFVRNLHQLRGMTWLMVGLGALGAYWFATTPTRR